MQEPQDLSSPELYLHTLCDRTWGRANPSQSRHSPWSLKYLSELEPASLSAVETLKLVLQWARDTGPLLSCYMNGKWVQIGLKPFQLQSSEAYKNYFAKNSLSQEYWLKPTNYLLSLFSTLRRHHLLESLYRLWVPLPSSPPSGVPTTGPPSNVLCVFISRWRHPVEI